MSGYIDMGSGYQPSSRDKAEEMAGLIERWLGNPISKALLKFCTHRCECGRRIELALRKYAGEDVDLCFKCNLAYSLVKKILDRIISRLDVDREKVITNMRNAMWRKGLASALEGIAA